ncbi:MAG TPA: pseudouridine synthase, partial [Afifellaceae bacterium]|nr:pseudouridine synthase [Afifellaceae bacterium]
ASAEVGLRHTLEEILSQVRVLDAGFRPRAAHLPTIFSALPEDMPRVVSIGRLDITSEGLLLLTNDGGLARVLALPATGWLRRYRVRAHGSIDQEALNGIADGITIDGTIYGSIEASLDRQQGSNVWLTIGLREGKNREVRRVLEHLGLAVNRLIRISFGPFQLGEMRPGEVREVRPKVLRDQLGKKLADAAGADFDAPRRSESPAAAETADDKKPNRRPPRPAAKTRARRPGDADRRR